MKLEVGQLLWWVPSIYDTHRTTGHVTVLKVGRKWAQLSNNARININTLQSNENDGYQGTCYLSRAAWEAEVSRKKAWARLARYMESNRSARNVPLEDIEAAGKLLGFKSI